MKRSSSTRLRYGTPAEAGMSADRIDRVRELCRSWVDRDVHKALAVLVARRGVVCLHEAFGPLGPHGAPPLQRDTIFPIQSISKVVTATALMMLVEDGLVGLTRPVQEYIPEFEGEDKELVCVHHLLTHTSGLATFIPDDIRHWIEVFGRTDLTSPEPTQHPVVHQALLRAIGLPLSRNPGEEMEYCTHNYTIVGEIVRRVTGRALADFAEDRVFTPLGMSDTSFVLSDEHFPRTIGWGLMAHEGDIFTSRAFRKAPFADAGVHSTPMDMAVLCQTFLNGGSYGETTILRPSTVAEMTRNQIPGVTATLAHWHSKDASWSYGWGVAGTEKWNEYPSLPLGTLHHTGGGAMMVWVDPVHEIVATYFAICRYRMTVNTEPITNVDLFANAVTAAAQD